MHGFDTLTNGRCAAGVGRRDLKDMRMDSDFWCGSSHSCARMTLSADIELLPPGRGFTCGSRTPQPEEGGGWDQYGPDAALLRPWCGPDAAQFCLIWAWFWLILIQNKLLPVERERQRWNAYSPIAGMYEVINKALVGASIFPAFIFLVFCFTASLHLSLTFTSTRSLRAEDSGLGSGVTQIWHRFGPGPFWCHKQRS